MIVAVSSNYMMAAQMASANAVQEETVAQLDKDRYYRLELKGPSASGEGVEGEVPQLSVTYSYIPNIPGTEE